MVDAVPRQLLRNALLDLTTIVPATAYHRRSYTRDTVGLGSGFGGISTVRALQKALHGRTDIEIALVNQENYFVFQPMLAEVISGNIGLLNTVTPIRDVCPGATLYVRTVERIDLDNKVVITSHGFRPEPSVLPYDYLVLALGTLENFGLSGIFRSAKLL